MKRIYLIARRSETSMLLAPAGFERAKRDELRGTSESGVPRGRRMSPGFAGYIDRSPEEMVLCGRA